MIAEFRNFLASESDACRPKLCFAATQAALTLEQNGCYFKEFGGRPRSFCSPQPKEKFCMDAILRQIGELLVSSIPTIIALLIVWVGYRFIVYGKLRQVLEQRRALTQGAVERAQKEIAAAEQRTLEYEQRVREARTQIFRAQQANRQRIMEERNAALAEARKQAGETARQARAALEKDMAQAKAALEQQAHVLADRVIETVLKPAVAAGGR
jgi:F-type H+-transporting ATPase subunit b